MGYKSHPALIRTNPKGEPFAGRCPACGASGLTLAQMKEPCANPAGMTETQALFEAVDPSPQPPVTEGAES